MTLRFARQIAAPPNEELDNEAKDTVIGTLIIQPEDLLDIKVIEVNVVDAQSSKR